ncbi:hypothetical protein H2684_10025 [Clostridium sp. cel8]|uniref:OB-fold protein n=1 Tax=unclassified Clostridium TaxID=2614128 RepID=UPI0015F71FB1|nr:hypothetical protein [Clostridium sp. cel8]
MLCVFCSILSGCGAENVSSGSVNNEEIATVSENNDSSTSVIENDSTTENDITTMNDTNVTKDTRPRTENGDIDTGKLFAITPKELLAKPDDEFIKISADKFVHEFMYDKVAADNKYRHKYLELTGKVDGTKRDGDNYLIIVYVNDQKNDAYCWINNKEESDRIEALNLKTNGDEVIIRGVVNFSMIEKGYMCVALGSCALKGYSKK